MRRRSDSLRNTHSPRKMTARGAKLVWCGAGAAGLAALGFALILTAPPHPDQVAPSALQADGWIRLVGDAGKVTPLRAGQSPMTELRDHRVTIDEDYGCPDCRAFTTTFMPSLMQAVGHGDVEVDVRPINWLGRTSPSDSYSARAANAAVCVARWAPASFVNVDRNLYEDQPAEGGPGLSASELAAIAARSGATNPEVQSCIKSESLQSVVRHATSLATSSGSVVGTPTVVVDRKLVTNGHSYIDLQALTDRLRQWNAGRRESRE